MADMYFLSEGDRDLIRELLERERGRYLQGPSRGRSTDGDYDWQTPETYAAIAPVGGIGARHGLVPGVADCVIYEINDDPAETLQAISDETKRVYNLSEDGISAYSIVIVSRDKFGKLLIVNNEETSHAGTGTGTGGETSSTCCCENEETEIKTTSYSPSFGEAVPVQAGTYANYTAALATNTAPIAVTITDPFHNLSTGDVVTNVGFVGNIAANGTWTITVTGINTFTLNGSNGILSGPYTPLSGIIQVTQQPIISLPPLSSGVVHGCVRVEVFFTNTPRKVVQVTADGVEKINGIGLGVVWNLLDSGQDFNVNGSRGGYWEFVKSRHSSLGWTVSRFLSLNS